VLTDRRCQLRERFLGVGATGVLFGRRLVNLSHRQPGATHPLPRVDLPSLARTTRHNSAQLLVPTAGGAGLASIQLELELQALGAAGAHRAACSGAEPAEPAPGVRSRLPSCLRRLGGSARAGRIEAVRLPRLLGKATGGHRRVPHCGPR
jgi:hypothetical protein